jgi:hypothetical protein
MSQPRSAPPELPGFTLVRGIGGGGFADVFLYNQQRPFRPVAVKVLRAEHLSDESLHQFAVEADVMAQVSHHPSIVTIHTSGVAPDGRPYIVMEHYPNPHFGQRALGGNLAVAEVLRVGVQVASAVETAHRAGILHRDIKPANILTSEYGRPGLTDFGISAVRSGDAVGAAAGVTLAFTSPEVLLDEHAGGTELADVYSLCATIYSMLAGHSPSWIPGGDNNDATVLQRVVAGSITPMAREIPPTLSHLLHNGLAPDPSRRPPSALALARALQSIEQELSLPPTPLEIRDDLAEAAAPHRGGAHDEDGTRRAPKVVRPEGPPPVVPAAGGPTTPGWQPEVPGRVPAVATMPPGPRPRPQDRVPEPGDDGSRDADTVLRTPARAATPVTAPAAPRARRSGRPVALVAVAAVVVIGLAAAGIWAWSRRSTAPAAAPSTTVAPGPEPTLMVPTEIGAPTGVQAELDGRGRLTVTFTPPEHEGPMRFRITRTDRGRWPEGKAFVDHDASPAVIEGLPAGEQVCLSVSAIATEGSVSSERSPAVCARAGR